MKHLLVVLSLFLGSSAAVQKTHFQEHFLPENDLHLEDRIGRADANITEKQFNEIIDGLEAYYKPIVEAHGATLKVERLWEDPTVNAYAEQEGTDWTVSMFGGLARRPEITPDGFALVVCHELGHHLGGFAFYEDYNGKPDWAASEGQADYFATQACARRIWKDTGEESLSLREELPPIVQEKCDAAWTEPALRGVCYRSAVGGMSLASLLAKLGRDPVPQYDTPDKSEVDSTSTSHPRGQCRLDTYFSGSLCAVEFADDLIPGKLHKDGQDSLGAQEEGFKVSCGGREGFEWGWRPRCWFKAK